MSSTELASSPVSWRIHPFHYRRRPTRVVMVGNVAVGGTNRLRLQSMTTTDTMHTEATVAQSLRMVEAGCEIVRITAPNEVDARNLEKIKSELLKRGCDVPLVADIHFRPPAAMIAADFVEKVRINPGNFVDSKLFRVREYTDEEYRSEVNRIEEKFTPLVLKLKKLKRALRIGTNHGSLSDRIMNRFGDTPLGMVESAFEYLRICIKNDYHDIILSMKASNARVMIAAYRLLADRMAEEGMNYPFHLGVTEAGGGQDGRIKSAVGIGSLLEDGIGDTIRVSLTEDPEFEIPVAREIARRYEERYPEYFGRDVSLRASEGGEAISNLQKAEIASSLRDAPRNDTYLDDRYSYARRATETLRFGPLEVGGEAPVRIVSHFPLAGRSADEVMDLVEDRLRKDAPPEILEVPFEGDQFAECYRRFRNSLWNDTSRLALWVSFEQGRVPFPIVSAGEGFVYRMTGKPDIEELKFLADHCERTATPLIVKAPAVANVREAMRHLPVHLKLVVGLEGEGTSTVYEARRLAAELRSLGRRVPLVLTFPAGVPSLDAAMVLGSLICDGIADAVSVCTGVLTGKNLQFAYDLLQACGNRSTKTEFVSCPSCGRTLFDLQSTTERIKSKTGHLKGVKVAIMGCIVNGPGEMADADFGYVGGGPGKINLYVGKTCVEKGIPSEIADERLVELIKSHGKWVNPL